MELQRRNCTCNLGRGYTCTCPTDALEARISALEAKAATWTPPTAPAVLGGSFRPSNAEQYWYLFVRLRIGSNRLVLGTSCERRVDV